MSYIIKLKVYDITRTWVVFTVRVQVIRTVVFSDHRHTRVEALGMVKIKIMKQMRLTSFNYMAVERPGGSEDLQDPICSQRRLGSTSTLTQSDQSVR